MTATDTAVKVGYGDDDSALDLLEALLDNSETSDAVENSDNVAAQSQGEVKDPCDTKTPITNIHGGDTDSSDDEDNRYFECQKYNEYGKTIKNIMNSSENNEKFSLFLKDSKPVNREVTWKSKVQIGPAKPCTTQQKLDIYSDPVFGIRMINPLISSRQLQEKIMGRTVVTMASIKRHIANGGTESDWVIAGVVVQKSPIRTSQKGSQYIIWKISDLKENLKTISVFFFRNSHKNLWKTTIGTVVGILNPSVMEDSKDHDEATIAVDNAQKVMVFGVSKDYGICKAKKKNGENCTAFVNTNKCSFCIYHVQQEYKKCSRRSELQAPGQGRGLAALRNKILGKNEVFYAGQSYMAVTAIGNKRQVAKDKQKLQNLSQSTIPSFMKRQEAKNPKDRELLRTLMSGCVSETHENKVSRLQDRASISNSQPQLSKAADIDLSSPVNKFLVSRAKLSAVEWVKQNGKLRKTNPNEVRKKGCSKRPHSSDSPEGRASKILKMNIHAEEEEKKKSKETAKHPFSSNFMELLTAKSKHMDLVDANIANAQEEYFHLLEKKEKLEEKMLTTYKIPCKAVQCLKCKYMAFSASDLCKSERHPLKVTDAFKRFFCCKDCNNRTATLELIPLLTCKQCGGSQWKRAPMMKEHKGNIQVPALSIRGGEETFLGSFHSNGNLNLLVPE